MSQRMFLGDSKCYISALLGYDMLLRVDEGCLRQIEASPIYDIPLGHYVCKSNDIAYSPSIVGVDLNLHVRAESYTITKFDDGLASMPISDKRVGDCEVEELLYAIQKKMGIV